ncbi:2-oxo acid dehydrogenase subunit E2, partial [Micromonospora sp. NPDC048170]
MTGYLAALAALAVDAAPRLRPRAVGRFEPEQPEAGGGFETYAAEREAPAPPRTAARPTAPSTPDPADAPAPTAGTPPPVPAGPA